MLVEIDVRPDARRLRQFGVIALGAFGFGGALLWWKGTPLGIAVGLWIVGALSALFSLVWPEGNRPLFVLLSLIAFPVGFVASHVVLAVFFFGVLTPVGLLLRLLGRDPLERGFDKERASYWGDLPEPGRERDYFRQF